MPSSNPRAYLTARLDQLTAANAAGADGAAVDALARLIGEDDPSARAAVADALRLAAARDRTGNTRDNR